MNTIFCTITKFNLWKDCILEVRLYRPDVEPSGNSSPSRETRGRLFPSGSFGRTSNSNSLYLELSPTGRSIVPRGEHTGLTNWPCRSEERMGFPQRHDHNRFPDPRSNGQNFVDIERIRCGLDVRTTVRFLYCRLHVYILMVSCRRLCFAIFPTRSIR